MLSKEREINAFFIFVLPNSIRIDGIFRVILLQFLMDANIREKQYPDIKNLHFACT